MNWLQRAGAALALAATLGLGLGAMNPAAATTPTSNPIAPVDQTVTTPIACPAGVTDCYTVVTSTVTPVTGAAAGAAVANPGYIRAYWSHSTSSWFGGFFWHIDMNGEVEVGDGHVYALWQSCGAGGNGFSVRINWCGVYDNGSAWYFQQGFDATVYAVVQGFPASSYYWFRHHVQANLNSWNDWG